ncbi:hypothetical protein EA462_02520 [Natrarchaeobius halalkaliphilus]|uniref:RNA ligase domain-containing protein n=1 Tax=Natrarchaeobius halalkaliphilus TaxID=1679091 RepID=A0A3N6LW94_9EURY|nr:RNA ligase family protein [Natrarchaeobius halalkaliphilus]RQG93097.1 hypothetical protein EA462_02520 [Natrarchaeobius halalkaliphilus]
MNYPAVPPASETPELFEEGHLWLLEKIDGAPLRFRLQQSGLIRFGDRNRWYEDPGAVPEPYQHAVRHVRANLRRDQLRTAIEDVEAVVFFGEATHKHAIEYEWDRLPSFLGFDVRSARTNAFYPPDIADQIFERIGLRPVNAVERERRARDFDPDSYTVPRSNWYDGPAEGVVIRNKRGGRATLTHPSFREAAEPPPLEQSASALATTHATRRRLESLAQTRTDRHRSVTADTLVELVLEEIVRREHDRLFLGNDSVEMAALRSAVTGQVRPFLETYWESRNR